MTKPRKSKLLLIGEDAYPYDLLPLANTHYPAESVQIIAIDYVDLEQASFDEFPGRYPPAQYDVFVAIRPLPLGFYRQRFVNQLRQQGYTITSFISPQAVIAPDVQVGDNCVVPAGAVIGPGTKVSDNAHFGIGTIVGSRVEIGQGVWLEAGVVLGSRCRVGDYTVIRTGVHFMEAVDVGRECEINLPGLYRETIPDFTFLHPYFAHPVRISVAIS